MEPLAILMTRLRKLLRQRGKSGDEADDVIQEAFLRLQTYRQEHRIHQPEAFLVRTVLNLSVDAKRRRERWGSTAVVDSEVQPLIDPGPTPDEVLASQQRLQHLRNGLESLAARTREVLLLHRIEGFSHAQIAERLGITVSAVEKHVAKGALFLTEWMGRT